MSPIEIEGHLADAYTRALLEVYLQSLQKHVAARLAQTLVERLFPDFKEKT